MEDKEYKSSKMLRNHVKHMMKESCDAYDMKSKKAVRAIMMLNAFVSGYSLAKIERGDMNDGDFRYAVRIASIYVKTMGLAFDIRNFIVWINETTSKQNGYTINLEFVKEINHVYHMAEGV